VKRAERRRQGLAALELIEQAIHQLRAAPPATLASYYLGALPFVLGLLYFWGDMSRSAFAEQHVAGAALGVAALFLWMKFWQAVFARNLRASFAGEPPPPLGFRRGWRILVAQTALQPSGLFALPLAFVVALPFAWVFASYQNLTVFGAAETGDLRFLLRKAARQATLWPRQNHILLASLFGFGFYVFLNWTTVCLALPWLAKMLFGVGSAFTRSPLSLLNTTFLTAMLALTYLAVDPIVKAVYALRCFYGESIESGEDLKVELRRLTLAERAVTASILLALTVLSATSAYAAIASPEYHQAIGAQPSGCRLLKGHQPTELILRRSQAVRSCSLKTALLCRRQVSASGSGNPQMGHAKAGATLPASVSPQELDRAISEVIRQTKYAWRMPREKLRPSETEKPGIILRFLQRVGSLLRRWSRAFFDWLDEWLRRLFRPRPHTTESGYGWIMMLEILLYALLAAVIVGLLLLLYRVWRNPRLPKRTIASQPIQPALDLADESLGAEQLPEDRWTALGRQLLERGELRLAARAFFFASLAYLAERNLISLARFKSNRDYEQELRRRGHSFPEMLALFSENVLVIDRTWYGLHQINAELVHRFAANVERIKTAA
jgi:hypothetical protein